MDQLMSSNFKRNQLQTITSRNTNGFEFVYKLRMINVLVNSHYCVYTLNKENNAVKWDSLPEAIRLTTNSINPQSIAMLVYQRDDEQNISSDLLNKLVVGYSRNLSTSYVPLDVCRVIAWFYPAGRYIVPNDQDVYSVIFSECNEELKRKCLANIKKQMHVEDINCQ
eukprot:531657_1